MYRPKQSTSQPSPSWRRLGSYFSPFAYPYSPSSPFYSHTWISSPASFYSVSAILVVYPLSIPSSCPLHSISRLRLLQRLRQPSLHLPPPLHFPPRFVQQSRLWLYQQIRRWRLRRRLRLCILRLLMWRWGYLRSLSIPRFLHFLRRLRNRCRQGYLELHSRIQLLSWLLEHVLLIPSFSPLESRRRFGLALIYRGRPKYNHTLPSL